MELQGLHAAHSTYGRLTWSAVVQPAIQLAERGFTAHPYLAKALAAVDPKTVSLDFRKAFMIRKDRGGYRAPSTGETCCARPALARLLRDVAARGPVAMYSGTAGAALAADVRAAGGVLTAADLAAAADGLRRSEPLVERAMGLDFLVPGPPSSALTVVAMLRILEGVCAMQGFEGLATELLPFGPGVFRSDRIPRHASITNAGYKLPLAGAGVLGTHRMVEAMKHVYAARMSLGDPGKDGEFLDLNPLLADLRSAEYAETLR